MPEHPVRLRVPANCPRCKTAGSVALETTINGDTIELLWACRRCDHVLPMPRRKRTIFARPGKPHMTNRRT